MGLGDYVNRVITKVDIDTKGAEKSAKSGVRSFLKLAGGVAAVTGAVKTLEAGFENLQHNTKLAAATVGADIEGLRTSTRGLVDDTRLLEFASKAMNGSFKLSQAEMQKAMNGALALRKTLGVDLKEALDVTQQAITEGNIEPLKALGVVIKGVEGDSQSGVNAAIEALSGLAREAGGDLDLMGDDTQRAGVRMANSMDRARDAIGKVARALTPIIEKIAVALEILTNIEETASALAGVESQSDIASANASEMERRRRGRLKNEAFLKRQHSLGLLDENIARRMGLDSGGRGPLSGVSVEEGFGVVDDSPRAPSRRRRRGGGGGFDIGASGVSGGIDAQRGLRAESVGSREVELGAGGFRDAAQLGKDLNALAESDAFRDRKMSLMHQAFGSPAELDEYAVAFQGLGAVFQVFESAVASGVGAIIDGSKDWKEAMVDAIAESLKAQSIQMSIEALKHGAMAIGALAIGGPLAGATAGKHVQAAAMYAAGSFVAGAAAKALGAGGGDEPTAPSTAAAGAGGVAASGAGGGGDTTDTRVVILGDSFSRRSPREREANIRETMRSAGVRIEGDVIFDG